MDETKNVQEESIFSLYTREKLISHVDDSNRKISILLVKMNQREHSAALDVFTRIKGEEEKRLKENDQTGKIQQELINSLSKEQLTAGILDFEKIQRVRIADLYPFEGEERLKKEEKEKKKAELLQQWEQERRKALEASTSEELRTLLLEYRFDSLSTIEAGRFFDYARLSFMCRHPKTRERIFKDYGQVEEVHDLRVINWLMKELAEFSKDELEEVEARKEAESPDFTANGGLPKSSIEPQDSAS